MLRCTVVIPCYNESQPPSARRFSGLYSARWVGALTQVRCSDGGLGGADGLAVCPPHRERVARARRQDRLPYNQPTDCGLPESSTYPSSAKPRYRFRGAKLFRATPEIRRLFSEPASSRSVFDVELVARFIQARRGSMDSVRQAIYEVPLQCWREKAGSKLRPHDFVRAFVDVARISLIRGREPARSACDCVSTAEYGALARFPQ